jgi:hypothetical protein
VIEQLLAGPVSGQGGSVCAPAKGWWVKSDTNAPSQRSRNAQR